MKETHFQIHDIPAVLFGEPSDRLFLFVHGLCGSKADAVPFAEIACPYGWQVLAIDLPEHGERSGGSVPLDPFHVVPELRSVLQYASQKWAHIALRANSIGCWFSLLSFPEAPLVQCLFVSPLLDMERMIQNMMALSGVTEAQLERQQVISTGAGPALSWEYLRFVRSHPITRWNAPTFILRAEKDEQIDADTVETFTSRFGCRLTVMEGGEHWFHTPEELAVLAQWERQSLEAL